MITSITKANVAKYREKFAEATEALRTHNFNGQVDSESPVFESNDVYKKMALKEKDFKGGYHYIKNVETGEWDLTAEDDFYIPGRDYAIKEKEGQEINSLLEYFSEIEALSKINPQFTRMPQDEEFFFIDANKRTITVPQVFVSNGVGVQGDEVAEILYFKIDRFFDMDDLSTKTILIEWRTPDGTEGASKPWIIDFTTDPDYIIFGWPLSSEITKVPGEVEFSVRFYSLDESESKAEYSFSTLIQKVKINNTLNYDVVTIDTDESAVDVSNMIMHRLTDSVSDTNGPEPLPPEILKIIFENCDYEKITMVNEDEEEEEFYKVYLTNLEDGTEKDGIVKATGKVLDGGALTYRWIKRDTKGDLLTQEVESATELIESLDTIETLDNSKVYYLRAEDYSYIICDNPVQALENGEILYEKYLQVIINSKPGEKEILSSYQLRAKNQIGSKKTFTYSDKIFVEGPITPTIDFIEGQNKIIEEGMEKFVVTANETHDEHSYVSYLLKVNSVEDGVEPIIYESRTPEFILTDEIPVGRYVLTIESKLNGDIKTADSSKLRVTYPASTPNVVMSSLGGDADLIDGKYKVGSTLVVDISIEDRDRAEGDNITCAWYKYGGTTYEELEEDMEASLIGEYHRKETDILLSEIKKYEDLALKFESTYVIPEGTPTFDYYFCEVTNNYNGTKSTICSKFVEALD